MPPSRAAFLAASPAAFFSAAKPFAPSSVISIPFAENAASESGRPSFEANAGMVTADPGSLPGAYSSTSPETTFRDFAARAGLLSSTRKVAGSFWLRRASAP